MSRHPAHEFRDRLHGRHDLPPVGELEGATGVRCAVAWALSSYADRNGIASPGVAELQRVAGGKQAAIRDALRWLVTVGLLERAGGGHRGRATEWRLLTGIGASHAAPIDGERCQITPTKVPAQWRPTSGTSEGAPQSAPTGATPAPFEEWPDVWANLALAPNPARAALRAAHRTLHAVTSRQLTRHRQTPGQRTLPLWVEVPDHRTEESE